MQLWRSAAVPLFHRCFRNARVNIAAGVLDGGDSLAACMDAALIVNDLAAFFSSYVNVRAVYRRKITLTKAEVVKPMADNVGTALEHVLSTFTGTSAFNQACAGALAGIIASKFSFLTQAMAGNSAVALVEAGALAAQAAWRAVYNSCLNVDKYHMEKEYDALDRSAHERCEELDVPAETQKKCLKTLKAAGDQFEGTYKCWMVLKPVPMQTLSVLLEVWPDGKDSLSETAQSFVELLASDQIMIVHSLIAFLAVVQSSFRPLKTHLLL